MGRIFRSKVVIAVTIMMVIGFIMLIRGCSKEEISGAYVVSEVSEETPYILPLSYTNEYLKSEVCQIELMSDGTVILCASSQGDIIFTGTLDRYAVVDGKMKIMAPLGTTVISNYELNGKNLKLIDREGNYVVLKKQK